MTNTHDPAEEQSIECYLNLLLDFQALPDTTRGRTFMDISGYPRYENVCSNILAFYFHPEEEHGLGDLLLSSFLQMTEHHEIETSAYSKVKVYREWGTEANNRVDLVINCDAFTIGIENKIDHTTNNDFGDYARAMDSFKSDKKIYVLLGLNPVPNLGGGFISHTYQEFWRLVKERLGRYIAKADPKWLIYLIEFMETTAHLAGTNMGLQQTDKFFIKHHALIDKMLARRDAFISQLSARVNDLKNLVNEARKTATNIPEPRIWPNKSGCDVMVLDFPFDGSVKISFDLVVKLTGLWELQLFDRNPKSKDKPSSYLCDLAERPPLCSRLQKPRLEAQRMIVQEWKIEEAKLEDIQKAVCEWVALLQQTVASKTV
jgi:hypothetical protein